MFLYEKLVSDVSDFTVDVEKPADFDVFWEETIRLAKDKLEFALEQVPFPLKARVFKANLVGYGDTEIKGWYLLPENEDSTYPLVLTFHGYRGYASSPFYFAQYLLNGMAVLAFDLRGQVGQSGDEGYASGHVPGWMNQGLDSPYDCYYRRLLVDCMRMVDMAKSLPDVDASRIAVKGASQGGGLALAVAALCDVALCVAGVPNMCYMEYGVLNSSSSLKEVAEYMKFNPEKAPAYFTTLRYFDNVNLADRIKCPVLVSVGMQDPVCLPKTVYAAYNKIMAPKQILAYPFSGHDGGGALFEQAAMEFILEHFNL